MIINSPLLVIREKWPQAENRCSSLLTIPSGNIHSTTTSYYIILYYLDSRSINWIAAWAWKCFATRWITETTCSPPWCSTQAPQKYPILIFDWVDKLFCCHGIYAKCCKILGVDILVSIHTITGLWSYVLNSFQTLISCIKKCFAINNECKSVF